ncbi:neuronal pentraxin-1 [Denticeps clupeoides]|uniref:Pentraxin (PTX) domain-containing protein n=1 Tax=Denticeps clupeoides TaxID=299321 RepID=A0AAY4AG72_9TELE|nr:neuronal pentraxin-1-like [Denticeps clupeoides]
MMPPKSSGLYYFLHAIILLSLFCKSEASGMPEYEYGSHPRFVCTPIPADTDPGCFPSMGSPVGSGSGGPGKGHHGPGPTNNGWWGMPEEAKATILHLRESLVQQKETILDQRETIRELTAKLTLCEGFGRGIGSHDDHHNPSPHLTHHTLPHHISYPDNSHHGGHAAEPHYSSAGLGGHQQGNAALGDKHSGEMMPSPSSSPEQLERMLHALKERLDNLQTRNTSTTYSSSLKDLLQRKIHALEQQIHHHSTAMSNRDHHDEDGDHSNHDGHEDHSDHHDSGHHEDHHDDSHHENHHDDGGHDDSDNEHHDNDEDDDHHDNDVDGHGLSRTSYHTQGHRTTANGIHGSNLDAVLSHLQHRVLESGSRKKSKDSEAFQVGFPMRTNYMYGRVKRTLLHEIFALTLCMWIKGGAGPGLGTPFSYSVPGQANELVLIEWGSNPMELLVNDRAVTLPLSMSDGKWHHVCVTWSTRDGLWEAYQDGVRRGSGENLSAWHPIKPGGVFILGQEQDTLGGRFDATQAFVGEISDVEMWSHVLTAHDIYSLASCGSHMSGDVITWAESAIELHGGVTKYPFDPCH